MRFAEIRTLLGECLRHAPGRTWLLLVLTPLGAVTPALTALGLQGIVDGVLTGSRPLLIGGAICAATAGAFALAGTRVMQVQAGLVGSEVGAVLGRRITRWCATLPTTAHLEDPESLRRIEQIRGLGPRTVTTGLAGLSVVQSGLWLVITTILLARVHPVLLVLPLFAVPSILLTRTTSRRTEAARAKTAERNRAEQHLFTVITEANSAKELRLGTSGAHAAAIARRLREERTAILWRATLAVGGLTLIGSLLFVAAFLGALFLTVQLALSGAVSPGALLLVATLGGQIRGQLDLLTHALALSGRGLTMVGHYLWFRDLYGASSSGTLSPPDRLRDGITLSGVDFSYGGPPVLHGIDLRLPAGATVALVGDHGSGKTTLVKLLCGFHQPTGGTITVDGTPLTAMDPVAWRERVTSAFQDFSRFPFLAREAVGVGDLPRMHEIAEAAEKGGAAQVFDRLPEGAETRLGKALGDGVELSGGQWQKIALSRAFMRSMPLLAVLDEPTAALDAASEYEVYQRYAEAAQEWQRATGGITLLVSHRFATIRMADLIVVLDGGRIIECGTHAELIDLAGRYAHLYNLQAAAYE
ncbi:ABC transporter ATP-binding protein/permease [Nonomuraea sp. NBC_00507]|uniref:ABC transporter ATP-binding protein n=1 Tax=Nonomuraea sp. NBC_00507 TaxID=2976002 RepID=UPI002E17EF93